MTTVAFDLSERLRLATAECEDIKRRLSLRKQEFEEKKTTCSTSEFAALNSAVLQLQLIDDEKRQEVEELEQLFANEVYGERQEFTRRDLIAQRDKLLAELNDGADEINNLQAQIASY